ncbi:hypothetical protein N4224_05335 [Yersinia enterocolitica]|uniref:hypothetical protein n=1 Tax=Yersinia enterocolitica TaxID=630 RepID=UPI0021E875F1|nr:hypothetical protein [Yersinia enterocolitica]UYJ86132.1 hypothetical protein N4W04_05325 [Yersinia enterocolitica]UYK15513.1 hypothetical protein N4224_05335 [Yersinia enterocolitica]
MADENTGLVVIDIKPESYPTLYVTNGLDKYLNQIRQAVNEVPDVTTAKGRARIASLAASASRSKTAIEKPGREYLKKLKEAVKPAEAEIKRFVDACDALRDETRRPLTEWEAEQDRLKQEAEAKKKAEELAAEIEVAHEMALLMNDAFDRDAKAKTDEIERPRKAHEEFIAQQAAEKAKREVEEKAKRDIEAAEQREREAKLAQERAEQKAEQDKKDAAAKAEREKQEAIAAEQRKAQETADRIQREAKQKEDARLAEEKRIADEAAARKANEAHRKTVGTAVVNGLIEHAGLTREQAIVTLCAIKDSKIPHTNIHY